MSRFGRAYPPIESPGDARRLNRILRGGMGEVDWSLEATLVDEHGLHFTATCYCERCVANRQPVVVGAPSAAELAEMERDRQADEREQKARRETAAIYRRWREMFGGSK